MNLQEYISSGIIESYVLGVASASEKEEFEKLSKAYPELVSLRIEFELLLEKQAFANKQEPPAFIKERVFFRIRQEKNNYGKIVPLYAQKATPGIAARKLMIAASVILLLGCSYLVYTLYTKNKQLQKDIAQTKTNVDKLEQKTKLIGETMVPPNYQVRPAKVTMPEQAVPPVFEVFWDSTSSNVYLIIKHLRQLDYGQRYELWSVVKGKQQSLGVFDPPADDKLIIKMNNVKEADSFAITILEPQQ